jgi:hypothetical protein
MWTLDFGVPDYDLPKVWVEHGIPDNHVISKKQFHKDIYYLCSNDWTYNHLKNEGLKAHHVGSIYIDKTIPSRRNPSLFVYAPLHCSKERHGFPIEYTPTPLTKDQIEEYVDKYNCEGYITSVVDDTDYEVYKDLNPVRSDRFLGMGISHFRKCKMLYEKAKVVYIEEMSTFDIVAEAHGIEVLGRDKQKSPRAYEKVTVLTDGKSCTRILEILEKIINGEL